ncbi:MAG: diguanylate cyclase [Candidatus Lernaella stagnicola]|nr:diguanylate cyclase [Candidatus Lernaella stagnicola]
MEQVDDLQKRLSGDRGRDGQHHILIVDDEEENLDLLAASLRRGNKIFKASTAEQALELMQTKEIHLVITDQKMPGMKGTELLAILQESHPYVGRILVTGFGDLEVAIDAINRGKVHRFATKPWDPDDIKQMVIEELERYDLLVSHRRLTADLIQKNDELQHANEQLALQKAEIQNLADEYLQQRELAIEMSEKFAHANLELINAQEEINQKNLKLEAANKKLAQLSITDGLTGFYNHRHMNTVLDSEIGRAKRYRLFLSLLMVDLDNFKEINDTYGHLFGDTVLRTATEIIRRNIRETDLPTRYGGDEFLVILPHTGIDRASFLAKRIHFDLRNYVFYAPNGNKVKQSVSIGIAFFPHAKAKDRESLIALADQAMYDAKQQGRDRIVVISP